MSRRSPPGLRPGPAQWLGPGRWLGVGRRWGHWLQRLGAVTIQSLAALGAAYQPTEPPPAWPSQPLPPAVPLRLLPPPPRQLTRAERRQLSTLDWEATWHR